MSFFSQSINFDEEELKKLEGQEILNTSRQLNSSKRLLRSQTTDCDIDKDVEIIDESPTNKQQTRKKYLSLKERSTQTKRRVIKRNKSDSVVRSNAIGSSSEIKKSKSEHEKINITPENSKNNEQDYENFDDSLSKYFRSSSIFEKSKQETVVSSENLFNSFELIESKVCTQSAAPPADISKEGTLIPNDNVIKDGDSQPSFNKCEDLNKIFNHISFSSTQKIDCPRSDSINKTFLKVPSVFDALPVPNFKLITENEYLDNSTDELNFGNSDNVTFTQGVREPSTIFSNNNGNLVGQECVRDFVQLELSKCKQIVKSILNDETEYLEDSTFSQLNASFNNSRTTPASNVFKINTVCDNPNVSLAIDTAKDLRLIANWGLPAGIVAEYRAKGIVEMFEWQTECLSNKNILFKNSNLVYSAPTSAGKTLVSELLMIKNVVERKKKAIFILPFVSVVREKMYYLQELLTSSGLRVEGFFGGYSPAGSFDKIHISVCTIEKANSIVNKLLESNKLADIGAIVVDEIHLISDPSRGYILELLLTKILYMCKKFDLKIQIIVMSATIPNLHLLQKWLSAELYTTNFRPVELIEMIKIDEILHNNKLEKIRNLNTEQFAQFGKDQDNIAQLCIETINEGYSVVIFCPAKDWCETLCLHIASFIYSVGKSKIDAGVTLRQQLNMDRISDLKTQYRNCPAGLDTVLEKTVNYGCAFHHAGLTTEEREITENGFKNNVLRVLVATSTLSSGVNLPARRVIIRTPLFGGKPMCPLTYRQMIGRAGRKGQDTLGESILICSQANSSIGKKLLVTPLSEISSCLDGENNSHLKRAILEIIASGVACTKNDLKLFVTSLLLCADKGPNLFKYFDNDDMEKSLITNASRSSNETGRKNGINNDCSQIQDPITSCLSFLIEYEFIRLQFNEDTNDMNYISTRLGNACLASSMPPSDGFLLFSELQKSRQCFVLECELHAIYLVTPYSVCFQLQEIDWLAYLDMWEKLSPSMKRVGDLVGIKDSFLVRAMRMKTSLDYKTLQIHKRFYIALALQELVNEVPICEVAIKFKCSRGLLQSLQQLASTFAGIVTAFCTSLNWNLLSMIVSQFKERLFFGIHHDLLDLMKIGNLNTLRARALYTKGIKTLIDLANADALTIEKILHDCMSFDSGKQKDNENEYDVNKRNELRTLFVTGKSGLSILETSKLLINEARHYLQHEMGFQEVHWSQQNSAPDASTILTDNNQPKSTLNETTNNMAQSIVDITSNDNSIIQSDNSITAGPPKRRRKRTAPKINAAEKEDSNRSLLKSLHIFSTAKQDASLSVDLSKITIINLTKSRNLIDNFKRNVEKVSDISISIGISKMDKPEIGSHLIESEFKNIKSNNNGKYSAVFDECYYVNGIAFYYEESVVYYLNCQTDENNDPAVNESIKFDLIKSVFEDHRKIITMYDAKEQIKILLKVYPELNHRLLAAFQDPCVTQWLLQPEVTCTLRHMVELYTPECSIYNDIIGNESSASGSRSIALDYHSKIPPKTRASVECFVSHHILQDQLENLQCTGNDAVPNILLNVEMPIQSILASMEVVGFPVNSKELQTLSENSLIKIRELENQIFNIHGRKFNISSAIEVAKVLGLKPKTSTAKSVLEKLKTPISNLIMQHRKLSATLNNTIQPLLKMVINNRIHGNSFCFTATGRITMQEPNLQNVAKDFEVDVLDELAIFSTRKCFETMPKKVLLSADFCQLELRILTHFSQDKKLMSIMKSNVDVFRAIASKWYKVSENKVTETQRNSAKQICYGIIYGMGVKSLAESLKCEEEEAALLLEQFHTSYPGIKKFTDTIIEYARKRGYVETLTKRRRYLPNIENEQASVRSQAERQAINTTIQGSAADISKYAIIRMDRNLKEVEYLLKTNDRVELVLHLHDELIYEVPVNLADRIASVLKHSMENCVQLDVPLKVKVKMGKNWGELKELSI